MLSLNPAAFNAHLAHIGQKMTWSKSYRCPCVNPHSGAATPNCPQCGGKGWIWDKPITCVAGVSSQDLQLKWAEFGMWQDGDTVITIPENTPMYEAGQFDRVLMLNNVSNFSLPLVRGGANEKLFNVPVKKITRVFWIGKDGGIVDGGIPKVDKDGSLSWANREPPAGTQYSVSGVQYNEYFCWGPFPHDRNQHQGARLPRRMVLRRFDLFSRDM